MFFQKKNTCDLGFAAYEIQIRLRACRRPSVLSPVGFAPPPNSRDALLSLQQGADPLGRGEGEGPKGTQGDQGDPGDSRAPSAPLGGMGPWGYSGAIPNEKPFRMEGLLRNHSELKAVARESRPTGDSSKCHQNCFETSGWLGTMCAI